MSDLEQTETPNSEEWLTVAEAAQRLELSERQVRRYAGRLEAHDRREPDIVTGVGRTRAGLLLRLSTLEAVAGRTHATQKPDIMTGVGRTQAGHKQQGAGHDDRPEPDTLHREPDTMTGAHEPQTEREKLLEELAVERQARAVAEARIIEIERRAEEISRERDDLRETKDKALQLLDQQQRLSLADRVKIEQLESELREVKKIGASEGKQEDTTEAPSGSQTSETEATSPSTEQLRPSFLQRLFGRKKGDY